MPDLDIDPTVIPSVEGGESAPVVDSGTSEVFDEAAFIAGLATKGVEVDLAPEGDIAGLATKGVEVDPAPEGDEVKAEVKAEDTKDEGSDPAVVKARTILAAASKKEKRVADSIANAEKVLLDEFRTNPTKFFERAGVSFKQWLAASTGSEAVAEPKEDDRVTALEKKLLDQEVATEAVKLQGIVETIHSQIKADTTKYPRINKSNSYGLVTDVMVDYHSLHGKPLPLAVAALQVENYLKTLAGEPNDSIAPKKASAKAPQSTSRPGQTTLTNDQIGSVPSANDGSTMDEKARDKQIMQELGLL